MTETRPTAEDLSAYVDGELDPDSTANVAKAIARDPHIAKEVACLTKLKATMPKIVPRGPIKLREKRPAQTWVYAIAASVAALVVLAGLGAGMYLLSQNLAKDWLTVAKSHHESWISNMKGKSAPDPPFLLAAASQTLGSKVLAPDLSAASLTLATASVIQFEQKKALHLGYVGTRGCRLSLFVLPIALKSQAKRPRASTSKGSFRITTWSHMQQGFILMATGMDPSRFALLTETLRNYSGFKEPFDKPTRQRLARSRAESKPCAA